MELNEIKKALYRENPKAEFEYIIKGVMVYTTYIGEKAQRIVFAVPVSDIGDAAFAAQMDAKHLIRYLTTANDVAQHISNKQSEQ